MKNIVVIGCSSGIGAAITEKCSESCFVTGSYNRNKPETNHTNVHTAHFNVLDPNPDNSFLPDTIDGLAYCPGTVILKPASRVSEDELLRDYRLQVAGALKVFQACLPAMKKSRRASVVFFSSIAASYGFTMHSVTASSKGALEALSRTLAAEYAPQIRVNCIAPSLTETPLVQNLINTPSKKEVQAILHPMKRIGAGEDIAAAAAWLLSDDSSWVTGQVLHIDGGRSTLR